MVGGLGDDTYTVDNTADVVVEAPGEGSDLVNASATYTLAANIENLTLTGAGNINATGNDLANVITGNAGNNILDGGAADGVTDTLFGGAGDDTYIMDSTLDTITDTAGTDLVQSSVTFDLSAANVTGIENLTLTGIASIWGTGNALDNVITGNGGDNRLDGGAGLDTLIGGAGNDTYIVSDTADIITEAAAGGTDEVQSSVDFNLATNAVNVENLTLTGTAINGTGNSGNNIIGVRRRQ
jgi:Ca2+-binding RTX toxin-like protein